MTKGALVSVCVAVWLGGSTAAAVQLPPDMMVDKYLLQAKMLREEKDHKGALEAMSRIVALQKEHDLTLPEAFPFQYAQTALAAGLVQAAIESVNRYLSATGREGKYYQEALALLVKAESTPLPECEPWNTEAYFRAATVESVTACLGDGNDPNARDKWKHRPLHWAAAVNENLAAIEALLAAGADPEARNENGRTPLHGAARNNENPDVIEALLKAGADLEARDDDKDTPLHWAAMYNENPAVIEVLLAAGADPEARSENGRTPLHEAAMYNENPAVIEALLHAGADLEARSSLQNRPLHWAAMYNENPAVIEALLLAGADLEARSSLQNRPLHWAARWNDNPAVIEALLLAGADPRAQNDDKDTPLHKAAMYNENPAVIEALLLAGADPRARNDDKKTPLQEAGNNKNPAVRRVLLSAGQGGGLVGLDTGNTVAAAGGGPCQIPGYPKPPAGVKNLGLPWCPASVGLQVRAFALQAAGAQCAISLGSSSTPEQIESARREIRAACARLDAWGEGNCQCPPGLRQ